MITSKAKNVCIIGFGKLGSHLYYALKSTARYNVKSVVKHSSSKIKQEDINNAGIIFICTQDSKIKDAVKKLCSNTFNLKGKYIYHTSGAQSSDLLLPLKKKGSYIGTFHPVQTFEQTAKKDLKRLKNIYIAIEGDPIAVKEASAMTLALRAHTLILSKEQRVLHHINCVIASNFLIGLLSKIEEIFISLKFKRDDKKLLDTSGSGKKPGFFDIYKPLIRQTLSNIELKGLENSLTGPVERNDLDTIKLHLNSLKKKYKDILPFYISLSIETAKLGVRKKSLTLRDEKALLDLMNTYLIDNKLPN